MQRTDIPLEAISPYLVKATVAIEDASFYTHDGIKPAAIVRALVSNIASGSFNQGGSTITQQVVKNTFLTNQKSIIRKLKEWILALRLENTYSKDQILETYLNETPYGGTIYGVEEASRKYFTKSAKDLTLSEAAYIAALTKAPTYYSPWGRHPDELAERHALVLEKMLKQKMITEAEYREAAAGEVAFAPRSIENIKAPHFVFYVLSELEKKYGSEKVYNGRLRITTTLDWNLQQESEKIIREGALKNEKNFRASNAGLVAIDPKSGQVLAMVGSRDYSDSSVDGQVNVTLAHRQPGSAFKPFAYATAFKKGYTPDTVLFDLKTQFSTACSPYDFSNTYPCYAPDDYDGIFRGPMTLRDALAQSINVVAVKTLYLAGIQETINTARDLGITTLTDSKRYGLTLVLGGGEVTLLEMTAAYGAFANDGVRYETTPLLKVANANGNTLETYEAKGTQVLDKEIARKINSVLSDNNARAPAFGAGSPLYFQNADVADKTGTTNDYRDAWVIGYTPKIVVGAWAGNNDNSPMVKQVSAYILAPMWHAAMEKAIARFPSSAFESPQKEAAIASLPFAGTSYINPAAGAHEILYWLNKNNPEGGNSHADPEAAYWDYPVALWAGQAASSTFAFGTSSPAGLPPGIGGPDGTPLKMSVTIPGGDQNISANKPFLVSIAHSEIENVIKVSYFLNGMYAGESTAAPFSVALVAGKEGAAIIRAYAESPLGNTEASATILVGANAGAVAGR
jgi:1A family penicillin-binding protein